MERTLAIIKPGCVEKKVVGKVIHMVEKAGFNMLGLKKIHLTQSEAEAFYGVHKGKPFFDDLVKFMTSGPVVVLALEKENAVEDYRKLIGSTDPSKAADGTIRAMLGTSVQKNCVHGSDSPENGRREVGFFFAEKELF